MPRYTKAEQEEAKEYLRTQLPAGSTVRLVLSRVSRSGMSRTIKCLDKGDLNLSWWIARACDLPLDTSCMGGVRIGGCGMDMGLHLVDSLSYALYGRPGDQSNAHLKEKGNGGLKFKWL